VSSNPTHGKVYSIQTLCDKSLSVTGDKSVVFSGFLHQ
jgi:hypothetical protein